MSLTVGVLTALLELKDVDFYKDLDKAEKGFAKLGKNLTDLGKDMSLKVTAPLMGLGTAAVMTTSSFQDSMSQVQAITGATGENLDRLKNQAKELGSQTRFSAREAADAYTYLGMAGWDTNEILSATPGLLNLAAAGAVELATASDIVSDVMSAFGIEASKANDVADVFAATASSANTDVMMLGESMKYAGAAAAAAGMDLEQTNAILGILADSGIKGSMAGTTLTAMLRDVKKEAVDGAIAIGETAVAVYDAEGNMRDLTSILSDVESATEGMTGAQRDAALSNIFQEQAMRGVNIALQTGTDSIKNLENELYNASGTAEDMAKTMEDNLGGSLRSLKSATEGLLIEFGEVMAPMISDMADRLAGLARTFSQLDDGTKKIIIGIGAFAAAIGPTLIVLGTLAKSISSVIALKTTLTPIIAGAGAAFTAAGGGIAGFSGLLTALTGPVGIGIAAVAGITAAGVSLYRHLSQEAIPEVERFGDEVSESTQEALGSFLDLSEEATKALDYLSWSGQEVTSEMASSIASNFEEMSNQITSNMAEGHEEQLSNLHSFFSNTKELTEEEQQEILEQIRSSQEQQIQGVKTAQERINEILETAKEEKRSITDLERTEINAIQSQMTEHAIKVMSENEVEQKAILERMKAQAEDLSARQAVEVVQNSLAQKEGAVQAAEDQYSESIKEIIKLRDEAGVISAEQADKLIEEAKRQKEDSIALAEEMHQNIIDGAREKAGEHVGLVDWETGEILSKWQIFINDMVTRFRDWRTNLTSETKEMWNNMRTNIRTSIDGTKKDVVEGWNQITSSVTNIWSNLVADAKQWGRNMIQGFTDGINSMASKVSEASRNVMGNVKGFIGFNSPAEKGEGRFIEHWGANMVDGFLDGVYSMLPRLDGVLDNAISLAQPNINIGGAVEKSVNNTEMLNFDRMFDGANIYVQGESDIKMLGREIYNIQTGRSRGLGVIPG